MNSSDIDTKMETKINFPHSNNKIWCKINKELEIIIPKANGQTIHDRTFRIISFLAS
jgi:hypothetical protein